MDSGRRQEWQYNIKYFGGDIQSFILPCTSIPFEHMSLVDINRRIESSIRQIPHDDSGFKLQCVEQNIMKLLTKRQDTEWIPSWRDLFCSIPASSEVPHSSYYPALQTLTTDFGGNIKIREKKITTFKR